MNNGGFGVSPLELLASDAMLDGRIYCEQFDYVARWLTNTPTAIGANGTLEIPVQIDASWDFVIQEYDLTAFDSNHAYVATPNFLLSFTRDGAGKRMSSGPVQATNICGAYGPTKVPGRLPFPVLLPAKSTYSILLQNLTSTVFDSIDLRMTGFKVYYNGDTTRNQVFHVSFD